MTLVPGLKITRQVDACAIGTTFQAPTGAEYRRAVQTRVINLTMMLESVGQHRFDGRIQKNFASAPNSSLIAAW
jgi:hypothetical protein